MKVRSFTRPSTYYWTGRTIRGWYCSCPDATYRQRVCKHQKLVASIFDYKRAWNRRTQKEEVKENVQTY